MNREMTVFEMEAKASSELSPVPPCFQRIGLELRRVDVTESGVIPTTRDVGQVTYRYAIRNCETTVEVSFLNGRHTFAMVAVERGAKRFSLEHYLKFAGAKDYHLAFWRDGDETFERYLDKVVERVCSLLEGPLRRVVTDEEWIDVPYDYQGYR